ncbi:sensor histidine kinase [Mediterraneibacter glycyrrhizinilyticus]|uniref:histidine kinase n=1 Tax=Candidatus Mediterraneibacter faecipullorum TaxID=2838670 RepID=A0A9D2STN1_9FIRM|nr:ATP-binding protein [Mediterraneibacter glycyrrhizinilyticus]MDM8126658.1 ATP-binding protein [Mediterraneibacter glycyrrhizinilyticus]MDM8209911.1 ATP-binding protein [Mediterraneibacter glycyrrhizinilyticus]HJC35293.1 two-component sensor histidine kinase [Candidatus Mediterraneibacter faecipullorum]
MRKKIQRSMVMVLAVTLLLSYIILTLITYNRNLDTLEAEVRQEAKYIQAAINISGAEYLEEMDGVDWTTRVTQIDENGDVLYDTRRDSSTLENHSGRKEVREALAEGEGEDVRMSDTVGQEMYYYALLLDDGTVLRASKSMDGLVRTALGNLPVMAGLAAIMLILAYFMAKWQTRRLVKPIYDLDLEHPLDNETYDELTPFLEAMDRQNKEKEAVSNMRKEFSANVSHELKTPLTSISGYAEIMKNGMVRPQDIPLFSERIYKEARRLITLVEDIIKLSKLDEESVELEKQDVDLYELTREIISRLSPQASQKSIRMEVTGEPVKYFGIRQILDEMIYNVCENAIKYNNEYGRVSVWVGNTLDGPKITVSDTGIGIPEEHHERIFERFYRVDKSHSKERGGTGLGLSIVKHGALLHGAKVSVESTPGRGTRIEMQFPKGKG